MWKQGCKPQIQRLIERKGQMGKSVHGALCVPSGLQRGRQQHRVRLELFPGLHYLSRRSGSGITDRSYANPVIKVKGRISITARRQKTIIDKTTSGSFTPGTNPVIAISRAKISSSELITRHQIQSFPSDCAS